jgi:outer membrane protein assembly factor BamB
MKFLTLMCVALACLAGVGCGGGGGSSTQSTAVPAWERFRHDAGNSGHGSGFFSQNTGTIRSVEIDPGSAISASPTIPLGGWLYVASEGGRFAAVDPTTLGVRWNVSSCQPPASSDPHACPASSQPLGMIQSSPTAYTLNGVTTLAFGSSAGTVLGFSDSGGSAPSCLFCFAPSVQDFATDEVAATDIASIEPTFVSSPVFSFNSYLATVDGIYIGAAITVTLVDGPSVQVGKVYALNTDGSLKWQFPAPGAAAMGGVTSSPALGTGPTLYFTTDDGTLRAITLAGDQVWPPVFIGPVRDPNALFAGSTVLSTAAVYVGTVDGAVVAINVDGTQRWRVLPSTDDPDPGFATSLALGPQAPTPTPEQFETPTPEPNTTPTPSPTPVLGASTQRVFGVTRSGRLTMLDAAFGSNALPPSSPISTSGLVYSSPALSGDGYVIFGTDDGKLYSVSTATGEVPSGWPIQLPTNGGGSGPYKAIRSSPTIATSGTIFVGADDGRLYAVGD